MKSFQKFINEHSQDGDITWSVSRDQPGWDKVYQQLKKSQIDWCNEHIGVDWGVNSRGEVVVEKDLSFKDKSFEKFEVQFANVKGDFNIGDCLNLVSLEGAPSRVGGNYNGWNCESLETLEGGPLHVEGWFNCESNLKLTSLKGAPLYVGNAFNCGGCINLMTLKGAPQRIKDFFSCEGCESLESLEGCPTHIGSHFTCDECINLESLKGAPTHVGSESSCSECPNLPEVFQNHPKIFTLWLNSGLSVEDFCTNSKWRGTVAGAKFGV